MSNANIKPQIGIMPSFGMPSISMSGGAGAAVRTSGMRECWLFNEGVGSHTGTAINNLHSGSLVNSPTWVPGFFGGRALKFGSSSYVNFGDVDLSHDASGTIVAWFRVTSTATFSQIVSLGNPTPTNLVAFGITDTAKVYFQAFLTGSINDLTQCDTTTISAGKIYYVAVTCNGSAWTFYINGLAQSVSQYAGLGTNSGRWFSFAYSNPPDELHVGGREAGANSMTGIIDHVRIYSRALKQSEIIALYQTPFADFPTVRTLRQSTSGAPTGTLKTYNGLANASIKAFHGLARASTKTVNTLTP